MSEPESASLPTPLKILRLEHVQCEVWEQWGARIIVSAQLSVDAEIRDYMKFERKNEGKVFVTLGRDGPPAIRKDSQVGLGRFKKRSALTITSPIVEPKPSQNQPVSATAISPELSSALTRSRFIR